MSHFIQPIDVDGTHYCCGCEGGRSTKGVLTDGIIGSGAGNSAEIVTDCGSWTAFSGTETGDEGELSFGVSCGSTVNLSATSVDSYGTGEYIVDVDFYIDGVFDSSITLTDVAPNDTVALSITGSPCGVIIAVHGYPTATDDLYDVAVTLDVTSIT